MDTLQQKAAVPRATAPTGSRKIVAWIVLIALLPAAFLVQTVLDDGGTKVPTEAVTVRGWAYADGPLRNATLSIQGADGAELVKAQAGATGDGGTFAAPAKLPSDFRITLTGGTVGEQVFTGRLVADVVGYGPRSPLIQVNPVTTLVAAYRDQHAEASPTQAEAAVRRFLKLPNGVDVAGDLRGNDQWFSPTAFFEEANAAGGVQPFVTNLVAQMDAQAAKTHAFVGAAQNDVITDVGVFVAQKVGSIVLSHVLEEVGLAEPTNDTIVSILRDIQVQLTRIEATVEQISQQLTQATYDAWAKDALLIKNGVLDAFGKLEYLASSTKPDKALANQVNELIDQLVRTNALRNLHTLLMSEQQTTGAYLAWSDLVKSKKKYWGPVQSAQLREYFDFYDVIQLQLIFLLHERSRTTTPKMEQVTFENNDLKTYNTQRAAQLAKRDSVQRARTQIDIKGKLMWAYNNGDRPSSNWFVADKSPLITLAEQNAQRCGVVQYGNGTSGCQIINTPGDPAGPLYGFRDWRLPTNVELGALTKDMANPAGHSMLNLIRSEWGPEAFKVCLYFWDRTKCETAAGYSIVHSANRTNCSASAGTEPGSYVLDLTTGKVVIQCQGLRGMVFPVRAVTAAEKYWL